MKIRREIVGTAAEKIPRFTEIAGELEVDGDDINGLSALTGLLIYLRWPYEVMPIHKAIRYLGLYKPTRENMREFEKRSGGEI